MTPSILDTMRSRRTTRKFSAEPVSDGDIDLLLEAAMYAPSRLDRQPWRFIVVRDSGVRNKMAETLGVHPYIEQAPIVLVVCAEPATSPTWMMDASAAIQNLCLEATELGLGTAWVGWPDSAWWHPLEASLRKEIGIPVEVRVASLIAIGHPSDSRPAHTRAERYDPTKIHDDCWGNKRAS